MKFRSVLCALSLTTLLIGGANAAPAVAYTEAGKFDSSFNEAVYREGVVVYQAKTGLQVAEKEPKSPADFESALSSLAGEGHSPIVAVGFSYADAVSKVAQRFPNTKFAIIDGVVDLPNVQSIVFKEHEGSFLVGALAALKSKSDIIGFVGGVDLPFIRRFACGYAQGAHYIDDATDVRIKMIGTDFSGFSDVEGGRAKANELIVAGADIIYAAAGRAGNGALKAADGNPAVLAIGVDSNQNFLHVGTMLTSMVKKVGLAAVNTWEAEREGRWQAGVQSLGVAEGGVDWMLDIFNRNMVSKKEEQTINDIRADIASGKIKVADYLETEQCPVTLNIN